jgi:class 3 adenylate cyclase
MLLDSLEGHAEEALEENVIIQDVVTVPEEDDIPFEEPRWLRVDQVVAVVADLKNSTAFNTGRNQRTVARFYEAYVSPLVECVEGFEPGFVDIQGDGLFALFSGQRAFEHAMCAGISAKTFSELRLLPLLNDALKDVPETGIKVGVALAAVLVKRVGVRGTNEPVWAGRPVNWAAKCAQRADAHQLIVTDDVWRAVATNQWIRYSCRCSRPPKDLWMDVELEKLPEPHREGHLLTSKWCEKCGDEFCAAILSGGTKRDDVN